MATIRRFEEIEAWKKARVLVREIYRITDSGPFRRDFGLKDQMRRAGISMMTNIAEGFGRRGNKEFSHFLDISRGSTMELQSLAYIALDADYLSKDEFQNIFSSASEIISQLTAFSTYLRASIK